MDNSKKGISRRKFVEYAALGGAAGLTALSNPYRTLAAAESPEAELLNVETGSSISSTDKTLLGAYGQWTDGLFGDEPGELSFRNSAWSDVEAWKTAAQERVIELLAIPDSGGTPSVTVNDTINYDGLVIEDLSWQLPYGPETRAYLVKPTGPGPFPGIIAMHDHGGNKYFGRRKIVRTSDSMHTMMESHQNSFYGGRALANELAKLGFAVLVPDVFTFASRRMLWSETTNRPEVRGNGLDVSSAESSSDIGRYNTWAAQMEHIVAKSLFSAGTTWPGVFLGEDKRALDVLAARADVDADNLGCVGLSGGGLRTVMLTGLDSRIKAGVCAGMMTTWRDYMLYHSFIHTWMAFMPHVPRYLDYSEIFALNLSGCLVVNSENDFLFELEEMKEAEKILEEVYDKAGSPEKFKCQFFPPGSPRHRFDGDMQDVAYDWFEQWLK